MAAELEAGLGLTTTDIRYIDDQLSSKTLTPELEQLCREHQRYGAELKSTSMQSVGDTPAASDPLQEHGLNRPEIEEHWEAELTRIRQQTPGLHEAWAVWCEREKLLQIRERMLSHSLSQPCMVQPVPSDYSSLQAMDPGAGIGGPMTTLLHPDGSLKVDPHNSVVHAGGPLDVGPQQVQPWDNNLHIQPLGSGHMGWDSGPHLMHPQQLPPHHMHPQAMLAQPGSIPLKLCRRCNVSKPVSDFYKSKANSDGYDGRCKTCDAVQCAERRKRKQRVEAPTVEYKTCRRCGCTKQSGDFYRNKTNPDGLYNNCKACFAADASARRDRMAPLEQRTVPQKICKRCKTPKPAADFYKNKLMSDGLYSHCKECYSLAATERANGRTPAESKECRRCKERKPASDFYNSKMTADGLQSYCKQCYAVAASQRRSKLQEQQGLSGLPQDVALGMEEQMGLPPGHMGPQMGISQSVPMDGQLMAPPHMLQNGQQIMQPQMTGGPTHMGTGQMGQPMQPHMVQQGMGPVSMGGAPMSGQQMAPHQLSMQQLGPAMVPAGMGMLQHVNMTNQMMNQVPQPVHQPMQPGMQQTLHPVMQHGLQQSMQQGMQQSMQQGMQPSMQQGMQQGMQPSMQQGMQLSMQQGMQPSMQQGMQPSMQQGMQPSMQQGIQPSMQQGMQPSMQQGMQPSMQQGMQPSMQQGMQQSMQQPTQQALQHTMQQSLPQDLQGSLQTTMQHQSMQPPMQQPMAHQHPHPHQLQYPPQHSHPTQQMINTGTQPPHSHPMQQMMNSPAAGSQMGGHVTGPPMV
eukprot:jgi/Botrbrau1/10480/Bobra.0133s0084.2